MNNNQYPDAGTANQELIRQALPSELSNQIFVRDGATNQSNYSGQGNQFSQLNDEQQSFANEQTQKLQQTGGSEAKYNYTNPPAGGYSQQGGQQGGYQQSTVSQGAASTGQQWTVANQQSGGTAQQSGGMDQERLKRLPQVYNQPIVAVRKDGRGNLLAFKTLDGRELNYTEMLNAGLSGEFRGLRLQQNREGELIVRSVPDGYTDNNLDNLPNF